MPTMRKVCDSMSKQRYLLVFLLLCSSLLMAKVSFRMQGEMLAGSDQIRSDYILKNRLGMDYLPIDIVKLSFENDLLQRDPLGENYNDKLYSSNLLAASLRLDRTKVKTAFRNTMYAKPSLLPLYPEWQALRSYEKKALNSIYLQAEQSLARISVQGEALAKGLSVRPYDYELNSEFELVSIARERESLWNYFGKVGSTFQVNEDIALHAGFDYQTADYEDNELFELSTTELALSISKKLHPLLDISSSMAWQHRQGEAISEERKNLLISELRLRIMLLPELHGYIQMINRSCSNPELSEILLISNYLRSQFKYSFAYDSSAGSFLSLGAKYSPENDADAIFMETDLRTVDKFYVGSHLYIHPQRQREYGSKLSYHFASISDVHLLYRYMENDTDNWLSTYAGIGVNLYY